MGLRILVLAFSSLLLPYSLSAQGPPETVSILVHLEPGTDRGPVRAFTSGRGAQVRHEYKILPNVVNLRNFPAAALSALEQVSGVTRIEEDRVVQAHLNNSTPIIRALQSQIQAEGFSADGAGIRVCIIDTGIDTDHDMYLSRIDASAGFDFVNNDNNPEDDNGHGAHVAGIALGGTGLTVNFGCVGPEPFQGVAPEATLIGVKGLDSGGSGSASDIIAGIDHCSDANLPGGKADVINMSLGGGAFTGTCDFDSMANAANAAVDAGVVVVASAGNEGNTNALGSPACGSKVIAVGATYDDDFPSCEVSQSSFTWCTATDIFGNCIQTCTDTGVSTDDLICFSNNSSEVSVAGPGCVTFSANANNSPNGIVGLCGTSMSSPHVAGLAALLLSENPTLTTAEVQGCIEGGAVDLGAPGFDSAFGHGRIDTINSLNLCAGCTPTENPEVSCSDGVDNDCDGLIDGNDPDCMICAGVGDTCVDNADCCSNKCKGPRGRKTCKSTDGGGCTPTESPEVSCSDGVDNDCDGLIDGSDPDCGPGCPLGQKGDSCVVNGDCCSNKCKGKSGNKSCK